MIAYKAGYKYQLHETYTVQTNIRPAQDIKTWYIDLSRDGLLTIRRGYAWDGASGISDRKSNRRASLCHDAIYQLLRNGRLPPTARTLADDLYERIVIDAGGYEWLARLDRLGLRYLPAAKRAAKESARKQVLYAP